MQECEPRTYRSWFLLQQLCNSGYPCENYRKKNGILAIFFVSDITKKFTRQWKRDVGWMIILCMSPSAARLRELLHYVTGVYMHGFSGKSRRSACLALCSLRELSNALTLYLRRCKKWLVAISSAVTRDGACNKMEHSLVVLCRKCSVCVCVYSLLNLARA